MALTKSEFERKVLSVQKSFIEVNGSGINIKPTEERRTAVQNLISEITGQPSTNFGVNTTDGQYVITGLVVQDWVLDYCTNYLTAMNDPALAQGIWQDSLYAYNNLIRIGATYTEVSINVQTSKASIALNGLDSRNREELGTYTPFGVTDGNGVVFYLKNTTTIPTASTTLLTFVCSTTGEIKPEIHTLNIPIPIIDGVVSVDNPAPAFPIGRSEETDGQFRNRFYKALNTKTGGVSNLEYALSNITGVVDVKIDENVSSSTNGFGTPPHSVNIVVNGGTDSDVANAIYENLSAGCGMKGATSFVIVGKDGVSRTINFDRPNQVLIWVKIVLSSPAGADLSKKIADAVVENVSFGIDQTASSSAFYSTIDQVLKANSAYSGIIPIGVYLSLTSTVGTLTTLVPTNFRDNFIFDASRIIVATQ